MRWVSTNTDIEEQETNFEQLEEMVNERTMQLKGLNLNLEDKNAELLKINKELEAFNYISSHDLQEPLGIIQTSAARIMDTENQQLSQKGKDYLIRINLAATRMRNLIQDLLSFSRVSKSEQNFEITNLNTIVDEVKKRIKRIDRR